MIFSLGLLFLLGSLWISAIYLYVFHADGLQYFLDDSAWTAGLGLFNVLFIVGVPIIAILAVVSKMLYHTRLKPRVNAGMWAFWLVNLICFAFLAVRVGLEYKDQRTSDRAIPLQIEGDTFNISGQKMAVGTILQDFGGLKISKDNIYSQNIKLNITKSKDGSFHLTETRKAQGRNPNQAQVHTQSIEYDVTPYENGISILDGFQIKKENKWRDQHIVLNLEVPEGKTLTLDKSVQRFINRFQLENRNYIYGMWEGKTWVMRERGLRCINCSPEEMEKLGVDKYSDFTNFNKIHLEGKMKVDVERRDYFKIEVRGNEKYTSTLRASQTGNLLSLSTPMKNTGSPIRVKIYMPSLKSLQAVETDDIEIETFYEDTLSLLLVGNMETELKADLKMLSLDMAEKAKLRTRGSCSQFNAVVADEARIDGDRMEVKNADLRVLNDSRVKLKVDKEVQLEESESSDVTIKGDPIIKRTDQNN